MSEHTPHIDEAAAAIARVAEGASTRYRAVADIDTALKALHAARQALVDELATEQRQATR